MHGQGDARDARCGPYNIHSSCCDEYTRGASLRLPGRWSVPQMSRQSPVKVRTYACIAPPFARQNLDSLRGTCQSLLFQPTNAV